MAIRFVPAAPAKAPKKPSETSTKPSRKGTGGRPKADDPKVAFTLRMERSGLERWQDDPDWRARMVEALRAAKG